ncbi:MAG TPA: Ni/Fe hydrogenase subunit alpha [Candidatus Acidoferrales bacterium]|nr:Ni/Fe hydrogenase subunit alpha [Candidatus Acidoferrales bacterium]
MKTITIEPVTRIEGHAKITIELDEKGNVNDAHFHVTEFRGFEKFCEGRPFHEMPSLMARICGICPVSHLLASAKACDDLMAVHIPDTSVSLRRLLNLAQIIQSHALSFFYLSSPDLVMGKDTAPSQRNILGLIKTNPDLARDGIRLRQFGQTVIELLAGSRIHPAWVVPGGVNVPLTSETRDKIGSRIPEALATIQRILGWYKSTLNHYEEDIQTYANFPTLFMSLVTPEGGLEHYDGCLRIIDEKGSIVEDMVDPKAYQRYIEEAVVPYSYLKAPYFKQRGYPDGIYRVGPLARLNTINKVDTPLAQKEWLEYRESLGKVVLSNFHNHYARLIEILFSIERMQELLEDDGILNSRVRALAGPNSSEGIGVTEAPRGTLIHHYNIDENGLVTRANLIVATGHNNLAMNRGVLQVAKYFVKGQQIEERILNRVEAVIRTFDPCLSCSTHAQGQMPIHLSLVNSKGEVLDEVKRY